MAAIAIVISSSLSSLSATSPSMQDEIKHIGHVFFVLFLVCTLMVVVGVVLEEVELRGGKSYVDPETGLFSPERKRTFATLGLWLLVIGITGEGLFEMARSWTDGLLQDVSNALLLNAEAQTGNAAKSARTAHDEADKAKASADAANTVADSALVKSDRANGTSRKALVTSKTATDAAADAQEEVDNVATRAVAIDHDLWQMQLWLTGRSIKDVQSFVATLKNFKWKKIEVQSFVGDAEGYFLCNGLSLSAQWAEMDVIDNCGKQFPTPPNLTGIVISGPDKREIDEFMHIVANAVTTGGAGGGNAKAGSTLTIRVGIKEPFLMDKAKMFTPPATITRHTKKQKTNR
jgi:hypothetical protein